LRFLIDKALTVQGLRPVAARGTSPPPGRAGLWQALHTKGKESRPSPGGGRGNDRMSYEASPSRGAPGRSLPKNAIVARVARFGGAAPLSLGERERTVCTHVPCGRCETARQVGRPTGGRSESRECRQSPSSSRAWCHANGQAALERRQRRDPLSRFRNGDARDPPQTVADPTECGLSSQVLRRTRSEVVSEV